MRIAFLIRALDVGGAERQLALLAEALVRGGHQVAVFVFYGGRPGEKLLSSVGVDVLDLRKSGRWDLLSFAWRLVLSIRRFKADVLYSFLPSANVVASGIKPFIRARVVWGIRAANMQPASYDWLGRAASRAERLVAGYADGIIVNSKAGYDLHVTAGYPASNMVLIRNGIEANAFRFDEAARNRLRQSWGVTTDQVLIGIVGRLDPMKGHEYFFTAAERVLAVHANVRFVVVGGGKREREITLRGMMSSELAEKTVWVHLRSDMASVYSAIDVLCSASIYGEGLSNTLAEGLLCGCVCVSTRVGDAEALIVDSERLFSPGNSEEMAEKILSAIESMKTASRMGGRAHVENLCNVERLVRETEEFLERLLIKHTPALN